MSALSPLEVTNVLQALPAGCTAQISTHFVSDQLPPYVQLDHITHESSGTQYEGDHYNQWLDIAKALSTLDDCAM